MNNSIAAVILTKNEEKHIVRCLESLKGVCDDVVVVDCFSDDRTEELATVHGARVIKHPWKNYATQFNYGVYECGITAEWIWRIDADEFLEGDLGRAVKEAVNSCGNDVNGIYIRKRIDFMGRPLLHGGWYPSYHLKVFRRGHGDCENRWMDEHIRLFDGRAITVEVGNQVDAKIFELKKKCGWNEAKIKEYISDRYLTTRTRGVRQFSNIFLCIHSPFMEERRGYAA